MTLWFHGGINRLNAKWGMDGRDLFSSNSQFGDEVWQTFKKNFEIEDEGTSQL